MSNKLVGIAGRVFSLALILGLVYLTWSSRTHQDHEQSSTAQSVSSVLTSKPSQVFEPVLPNSPVILPKDFAFHNDFQHEWWHYFANVTDQYGEEYGVQWSYFRIASHDSDFSGWLSPQLFVSHVVVTQGQRVWREQRMARGGIGQAGMSNRPFRIWIDNWNWRSLGSTPFPGQLSASSDHFNVSLTTVTRGPFALPGDGGYRQKHDLLPVASYNIIAPFLRVKGTLDLNDGQLLNVEGQAWMSKEWGSGLMAEGQQGWDWFVLHLDDETTLSLSRYRHDKQLPYVFGTLTTNDGKVIDLAPKDVSLVPLKASFMNNGKQVPLHWEISIPEYGIQLTTELMNTQQWLPFVIPYWEGPIKTQGTHQAKGFMQLTGY